MTTIEAILVFPFIFLMLVLMMGMFIGLVYEAILFIGYDSQVMLALYEPGASISSQVDQSNMIIAQRASVDIEGTQKTQIQTLFDKSGKKIIFKVSDMRFNHRFILTGTRQIEDFFDEIK